MPRTGLTSMRVALGQLLDGPCHHAADCFEQGSDDVLDFWMKGFEGKLKKQDWIDYFQGRGYRGAVDLPAMLFYR